MPATRVGGPARIGVDGHAPDATPSAVRDAIRDALGDGKVTMSVTGRHAGPARRPNRDSLHSLRADAIWTALPARDQHLLLWLLSADIVTSRLAALLVYGQLRIAQRRLSRLVELGLLRGFWAAGAQRPRGRYAYVLTRAARSEIERLAWPEGRSDRPVDTPASAPVHQLATLDLLVAFLRAGDPRIAEGLAIWIPERACGYLFGGLLRPDAVAGIRVGDRALTLFVERDLGTERGEALADKLRRYRSIISRIGPDGVRVGFVVPSPRRARAILDMAGRLGRGVPLIAAVAEDVEADPLGAGWFDGERHHSIRQLATVLAPPDWQVLARDCLQDPASLDALDDRAAKLLPALRINPD
ncbi:MAG: hypothetical protein FIA92_15350 [Chloroflexi bacterium]|nr:hypothetical protein [Chloroflexota bacterium]